MNTDIRLSVDFWDHPKTVKLERRLGLEAVKSLQILWLWAAVNRPDGVLSGMDTEDVEIAAKWAGDDGVFAAALLALRWMSEEAGTYVLYAWKERNAWAAQSDSRSDKARLSRMAKTHPQIYQSLIERGVKGVSKDDYESLTTKQRTVNDSLTNVQGEPNASLTPAPAPAPSPAPTHKEGGEAPPYNKATGDRITEQAGEVLDYLNAKTGKRFKTLGLIPARLRDGRTVDECKRVIDIKVADRKFDRKYLDHTTPFRPDNFDKYLNQGGAVPPVDGGMIYEDADGAGWQQDPDNKWARHADSTGSREMHDPRSNNGQVATG
jgi:uncharacterized phage protein (TIGR02220 family)